MTMNRRDFFRATGSMTLAGGAITLTAGAMTPTDGPLMALPASGDVASPQPEASSVGFRAKRVFLDSRTAGIVRGDSFHAASFAATSAITLQNRLNAVRRDGCNALILVPGPCSTSEWMKQIETEASRLELTVLVPAQLTRDFLREAQTVVPLAHEEGIFQRCDGRVTNEGGFLLWNGTDGVFGLVLYDASRCLWRSFASSDAGLMRNDKLREQNPKLTTARWLDRTRRSFS